MNEEPTPGDAQEAGGSTAAPTELEELRSKLAEAEQRARKL